MLLQDVYTLLTAVVCNTVLVCLWDESIVIRSCLYQRIMYNVLSILIKLILSYLGFQLSYLLFVKATNS